MNNMNWLLRATQWVRNPPSPGRVKLVLAIVAIAIAIVAIEKLGFWPDWATLEGGRGQPRIPR